MEPHELAIAALNEVADSHFSTLGSSRSKIAGNDMASLMTNNSLVSNAAGTHELPQQLSRSKAIVSQPADRNHIPQVAPQDQQLGNSNDNSQSTTDGHETISTPPTSTSEGFSSQSTNVDGQLSQLSQLSELAATATAARPNLTIPSSAGHKRTADGQLKANSPDTSPVRGHSRNTSSVSNVSSAASSKIGELSSELRTRLSYAILKVNNGWQSRSIDEVESLASQAGSPTSSTSTLQGRRNFITSPRAAMMAIAQRHGGTSITQAPAGDFDLYSRADQPSRTYESFWREHSGSGFPTQRSGSHAPSGSAQSSRSLGPAADIHPAVASRRAGEARFKKPPTIPTLGNHDSNSPYHTPRTPHRGEYRENGVIRTPSQKTVQEQDAIETLLFMSSPGNSGNMGLAFAPPLTQTSPQQSPLRAEFSIPPRSSHGRKVAVEAAAARADTESEAGGSTYRSRIHGKGPQRDKARSEAIDRMLDDMDDSSSDDDIIPHAAQPHRRIAAEGARLA